jgi:lysophospholipase L1-like esterase
MNLPDPTTSGRDHVIELSTKPMTWVATGDSITQGIVHTAGVRGWVEHVHERIRWQLNRRTDIVINSGVAGWRATDVLAAYDHVIGRFSPDVLSISLGTNDAIEGLNGLAQFHDSMHAIIAKTAAAQIVVHTPVLVSQSGRVLRAELPAYCQAVREIAADTSVVLVDHEVYWQTHFSGNDPIPWLNDPAHPNAVGHLHMANHTLRTLGLGELSEHEGVAAFANGRASSSIDR